MVENQGLGIHRPRLHLVAPCDFAKIPGAPFTYWVSPAVRDWFVKLDGLGDSGWHPCVTNPAGDDTRYFRTAWEPPPEEVGRLRQWVPLMKGGAYSPYYYDLHLVVSWDAKRQTYKGFLGTEHRPLERPASLDRFFSWGFTWPRRTNGLSFRALPEDSIFADKGPAVFANNHSKSETLALCAILNSAPFLGLVSLQLGCVALAQSFEVGLIKKTPIPNISQSAVEALSELSSEYITIAQELSLHEETSHLFLAPPLDTIFP